MTTALETSRRHYEAALPGDPVQRIDEIVARLPQPLHAEALAALDQFHVGGIAATRELATAAAIEPGAQILDVGCGLGGPARTLAHAFGADVTGIDLSPAFVSIASRLSVAVAMTDRTRFEVADAAALPFETGSFDIVWTQHAVMNFPDRAAAYGEMRRVLKPGGKLAFDDVLAGQPEKALHFPTPWASNASESRLLSVEETQGALTRQGFSVVLWRDVTAQAQAQFPPVPAPDGAPTLGAIMGERFQHMAQNLARNIMEDRVALIMAVCTCGAFGGGR